MANQMLASAKGTPAGTPPNKARASTTQAPCGASHQTRTGATTPIGRHPHAGARRRPKRTAGLDGKADAAFDKRSAHHDLPGRRNQPP